MKQAPRFGLALVLLFTLAATALAASKIEYSGGDGSSFDKAIIIKGATESTGVDAEYAWLAKHYPGYKTHSQALLANNGRNYDQLDISTADGNPKTIYFDISDFFGKF